ncbi:beta-ketoacyl-ACP synthase II [Liquorilactobacillus satsumensis]|nr:beta-ketoacyl-ACP synthase II [Liquorilactobacillus satsumensis]MCC7666723.1 beta-ketoacyl-[acyl-carrier-protein] synthase II [Liquorilactobacillus satsumensis]MCP9312658.1 beta-ketoacyl-ACP synthase II [Liquorilactobacillus satsumensis]MCP9357599.1 beta-ketoacyl-ACP synthase II [Liquorilactobacillus satsumensis]MCP9359844.1 beta-ketoacyl-ACP synthase II [Liquorilactobacillus satsumensis]MCP9371893.1 beta-ketoacyl-ACP synthase II [Liquorilactobacillus satsumensis]
MNRVVVTGMGAVTPVGNDVATFLKNIFSGKIGFDTISKFDASETGITVAGEVKDFDPKLRVGKKAAKRMDLFSQYAVDSAIAAVEQAGIDETNTDSYDMGVIYGSGIGGLTTIQEQVIKMKDKGPQRVSPMFVPTSIANMAAGNIALRFKAKGICTAIVTACSSGTNAIGEAFRQIREGRAQVMLTGGAEASVNEIGIAGFAALTALSKETDPARASLPFDVDRSGFVMGEGAATLVLEELEHAQKRGAKIYGEIVGYGSTCDAFHMTSPDPTGEGAARAMQQAIAEADVTPEQIGYINAHGTATHANDTGESIAINRVFGEDSQVKVSSTKSMTGHLLGAAGAIEAVITIAALEKGELPANVGLKKQDPECHVNVVTENAEPAPDLEYAISNSLGFGGHNAVLAFRKWSE